MWNKLDAVGAGSDQNYYVTTVLWAQHTSTGTHTCNIYFSRNSPTLSQLPEQHWQCEDKELPSVKAMRSETARWGNVLCNLYLVPLKMKSLWSLDLKIYHISWAQKLVLVKLENSKEKREVSTLIKCIGIDTGIKTHHLDLNCMLILLPLVA